MRWPVFLMFAMAFPVSGNVFEAQVEQAGPQIGDFGEYRLWLPPNAHPKQILVLIWGGNQCSLNAVDDPGWQDLARSMNCALLAAYLSPQNADNPWDHADEGSGAALLKAIETLAINSGEHQLANGFLYLVGDSQGGQFAFSFASWEPARTAGFVSLKGGHHDPSAVPGAAKVPGLFVAGEEDVPFRVANIEDIFAKGRGLKAPWCLAIDPRGDHSPSTCGYIVSSFLRALALARSETKGGNDEKPTIFVGSAKPRANLPQSWFPTTGFEEAWETFESGNLEASVAKLNFASLPASALASVTPAFEDLGAIEAGKKSLPFTVAVTPVGSTNWDEVSVLDCPYLSEAKIVRISPKSFSISDRLNTSEMSTGRFSGAMPLRFKSHNKPVLGGTSIPLLAVVTGDVNASPSLILLNTPPRGTESVHLTISSKTKHPLELLSYNAPPGITVISPEASTAPLVLTVRFQPVDGLRHISPSGLILLRLKTDKEWKLRVPYIHSPSE